MRLSLYAHALRAARARQLRARVLRPLRRRRFPAAPAPALAPPSGALDLWRSAAFEPAGLSGTGAERLRRFHAHYGEDVLRLARSGDAGGAREALHRWIDANPPRPGDAWHPYTTSTRAGNWVAALALAPEAGTRKVEESLWRQLLHLERNVEDDILGNHVVRNARALALGGAAFGSARLRERGLLLLERELPEQVLPDGGHYERSPVYHLIVLRDLLEVEAALPGSVPADVLERMRRFAAALNRPDGRPALFNDGTLDLAPQLELPRPPEGLALFPETGYAVWRQGDLWLAFDCGPPAPPYLPAHAHADALSFQLWLAGRPVVVDPGMPTYEAGAERDWFRGTRAHSTVGVDGRDQFELWGAFRTGPLPRVELLEADDVTLRGAVERAGMRHERALAIEADTLMIDDVVSGRGVSRIDSVLPWAPGREQHAEAAAGRVTREPRRVAERLYERVGSAAVVASVEGRPPLRSGWRVELEAETAGATL